MRNAVVTVGAGSVSVAYPERLDPWFRNLTSQEFGAASVHGWVRLEDEPSDGKFRVTSSDEGAATVLGLGDALAMLWERVTFLLVDRLDSALALHAATVHRGNDVILMPGSSGCGKTQLALWYRAHGYALASDELVVLASATDANMSAGALARPLFVKHANHAAEALPDSLRIPYGSAGGELRKLVDVVSAPPAQVDAGFIVFPRYEAGSSLGLTPLTPAQAGLRLLEHCVNVRNLPRSGLALVAAVARRFPAVSLRYGKSAQLDGTLDVLSGQTLASKPAAEELAALCEEFTARTLARENIVTAAPDRSAAATAAVARPARRLTVGMATYDEYDGVYFTIQSIRLHHPELAGAIEFIVVDNNPEGPCGESLRQLEGWIDGYRYVPRGERRSTAIRDVVFEEASCDIVLCVDPHVLIVPGALSRLVDYCDASPGSRDLLQGPLLYDDLRSIATHFEPGWRGGMYGTWHLDPRGAEPASPAFDIPMQGLGLFACRRDAWPGFNPAFRGFGGEEGYIHEKIRQRGGRTLCLPFLRWIHRFARPLGTPYPNRWEDRIHNYYVGFTELGLDTAELEAHFTELLGAAHAARIFAQIRAGLSGAAPGEPSSGPQEPNGSGRLPSSDEVYAPHNYSFGDQWATINFYLNMSVMKQQTIRVASLQNGVDLRRLQAEILDALDSPGEIELVHSPPTVPVDGFNVWNAPYFPTRRRWDARRKHRYVCVQLDGQSAAQATNPLPEEERAIRMFLAMRCQGLELITLGKHYSVRECVEFAADSALFVGVDSGMSHLCHSVGVPLFLLEYALPTITVHAGKSLVLCRGFEDFRSRFDRYVDYLHAVRSPDAPGISRALPAETGAAYANGEVDARSRAAKAVPEGVHTSDPPARPARSAAERQIRIRQVLSLLTPHAVQGFSRIRVGGDNDGGYLLIDDLDAVRLCYSIGIGMEASFDYGMAQRGILVLQYDHTVAAPPLQHSGFRFRRIGVAAEDGANMRTIKTLLENNGHALESEIVLKMDIEGAEWDVLDATPPSTLERFKQITCEFHGFSSLQDDVWRERAERVFRKVSGTHAPVHVHGNNYAPFHIVEGVPVPDVMEVTFARRSSYGLERGTEPFPCKLDQPNRADAPDWYLGRFEFP